MQLALSINIQVVVIPNVQSILIRQTIQFYLGEKLPTALRSLDYCNFLTEVVLHASKNSLDQVYKV